MTMSESFKINVVAKIYTDFPEKFGLPRQSGLVPQLAGKIVFEPKYRNFSAVKELADFSHIWVIWNFSKSEKSDWSPTVRPPRLGGNRRVGVFATRSPFRPNSLGLSALKLEKIENDKELGPILYVSGIDMVSGTPIFDIKPYLSFADSYPQAVDGFAHLVKENRLKVEIEKDLIKDIPKETVDALYEILAGDPRPHYHNDENRVYGFEFSVYQVKFIVKNDLLKVISIENIMALR